MPGGGARHGPPRLPLQHPLLSNRSLGEGLWARTVTGSDACCSNSCIFPPCLSVFQEVTVSNRVAVTDAVGILSLG